MTEELFREDAQLLHCQATVVAVDEAGVVLDRTVFYPLGGGQAGDAGMLVAESGAVLAIADTRKHKERPGAIAHVPAAGADRCARHLLDLPRCTLARPKTPLGWRHGSQARPCDPPRQTWVL